MAPRTAHPTSIRLTREIKAYVASVAAKDNRSVSYVINDVLRRWREWRLRQEQKDVHVRLQGKSK